MAAVRGKRQDAELAWTSDRRRPGSAIVEAIGSGMDVVTSRSSVSAETAYADERPTPDLDRLNQNGPAEMDLRR